MKMILALPPHEVLRRLIRVWHNRPELPPGLTYNVSSTTGSVVVGLPFSLEATVVGTATFGRKGSDVDFGLRGVEVDSIEAFTPGARIATTRYARGVTTVSENLEIEEAGELYSFMALPSWRLVNDAHEYARAASLIHASIGLDEWVTWKRRDKIAAYQAVGITCKGADGEYNL